MLHRQLFTIVEHELTHSPAVALLGPRQVGKTTLALDVAAKHPGSIYLDLESEADRFKLSEPELYLSEHLDKLVILDEVHRAPGLFPILRGLIDRARRRGHRAGRYLLLGSASLDLLKQSGESLAGRIAYLELGGLTLGEVGEARHALVARRVSRELYCCEPCTQLGVATKLHSHLSRTRYSSVWAANRGGNPSPLLDDACPPSRWSSQCRATCPQSGCRCKNRRELHRSIV
jgi:predicted AAA+ superfamily ATPase